MEDDLVHNDSHSTCCGHSAGECTCAKNEPEPKAPPVINSEGPVGGALGQPEWNFQPGGVVANSHAHVAAKPAPIVGPYALAGAGQFESTPPVNNAKADDNKPAGGVLGQPVWDF